MARLYGRGTSKLHHIFCSPYSPAGPADQQEPLTTPIFDPDWGADEEILLISGLITYGLGNWLEVAAYIGTRTKEDCERHYCQTFLGCTPEGQPYDREKDMAVPPHTAGGNGAANGEADGTANGTQNGGGADPERIQGQAEEAEESKRKRRYMPVCLHHVAWFYTTT